MIRLLQGSVHQVSGRELILLTNGVGYQVLVPAGLQNLDPKSPLTLWVHTHVREDILALYGFASEGDLLLFEELLTVNGIGPKMALELLSVPAESLSKAILTGDLVTLTHIPGIGKKLAERLILELKNKLNDLWPHLNSGMTNATRRPQANSVDEDAIAALESLGYKRNQIDRVFSSLEETPNNTEAWIKAFLQRA